MFPVFLSWGNLTNNIFIFLTFLHNLKQKKKVIFQSINPSSFYLAPFRARGPPKALAPIIGIQEHVTDKRGRTDKARIRWHVFFLWWESVQVFLTFKKL